MKYIKNWYKACQLFII